MITNPIINTFPMVLSWRLLSRVYLLWIVVYLCGMLSYAESFNTRLKDIALLANVQQNTFVGYGLVVGLPGTGDRNNDFAKENMKQFLSRQGIKMDIEGLRLRNSASVIVSAKASGFLENGDKVDLQVSSIADARQIERGVLLPTTLRAGNGERYIVASGSIEANPDNPATGSISDGGAVIRDFRETQSNPLQNPRQLFFKLENYFPDYSVSIKRSLEESFDNFQVSLQNEKRFFVSKKNEEVFSSEEILELLNTEVEISPPAMVIIDKQSHVIIVGSDVQINKSHISVQAGVISLGNANPNRIGKEIATVSELMEQLNGLSLTTNEIVSIFNGLKRSGAMNATIVYQ